MKNLTLYNFIKKENYKKIFTPSPSFPLENVLGLSSFSRGDEDFIKQYNRVMNAVKNYLAKKNNFSSRTCKFGNRNRVT